MQIGSGVEGLIAQYDDPETRGGPGLSFFSGDLNKVLIRNVQSAGAGFGQGPDIVFSRDESEALGWRQLGQEIPGLRSIFGSFSKDGSLLASCPVWGNAYEKLAHALNTVDPQNPQWTAVGADIVQDI